MSTNPNAAATPAWPAAVIHVNEDGWVLINRGRAQGVLPGLRLLVVGKGIRDLRDLQPRDGHAPAGDASPVVRIRRTFEQLEVLYAEETCAIAIATRTPPARRPSFYRGPEGELLVWVPLPEGYTWPLPGGADLAGDEDDNLLAAPGDVEYTAWQAPVSSTPGGDSGGAGEDLAVDDGRAQADTPPERGEQDDERWEEALPLNAVAVGDLVLPAIPAAPASASAASARTDDASGGLAAPGSEAAANPFDSTRAYDWLRPTS